MMGLEFRPPIPTYSSIQVAAFDVQVALVADAYNPKPWPLIPAVEEQNGMWAPAKPLDLPQKRPSVPNPKPELLVAAGDDGKGDSEKKEEKDQWDIVNKAWEEANAMPAIDVWAKFMGWGDKIKRNKPNYIVEKFKELFLEASYICIDVKE